MSEERNFFDMTTKQSLVLGLAVGIALVSLAGFTVMLAGGMPEKAESGTVLGVNANVNANTNAAPAPTAAPAETGDVSKLAGVLKDARSQGPSNAKVTLIEISDFQCPYCQRHSATMDQIMKDYDGKVRKVWINFPLTSIHPQAMKASEAAECAGDQGKFWEMHNKIFDNISALSVDNLKQYAADLKLNAAKFNSCLDEGKYAEKIQAQMAAAQAAGVSGTPGTFVNGQLVKGAYPYETFKQIIDQELAK